ncbi:MAG: hypothetical protein QUS33_03235 [Dehalococcoidia bacterium]|nr:hypothetical protein [Dehalococcoidia bacterium]
MATPLNIPRDIRVTAGEGGNPVSIWMGKRQRRVVRIRNVWRIDDEWWRQEISRRYFELELNDGSVVTIFQDLVSGNWSHQRY